MQQILSKSRMLLFIAVLLLALVLYCALAMKIFRRVNLMLVSLAVFAGLLFLLSGSPFRVLLVLVLSFPLGATMAIEKGFTILPGYIVLLLLIFIHQEHQLNHLTIISYKLSRDAIDQRI